MKIGKIIAILLLAWLLYKGFAYSLVTGISVVAFGVGFLVGKLTK